MPYLNIAAYRFTTLDPALMHAPLLALCRELDLCGTILLAPEGINLFIAGAEPAVRALQAHLAQDARLQGLSYRESWSETVPFGRMRVKIKREIIPMGRIDIDPAARPGRKLPPEQLKQWLDDGREVVLLDTRNDYEVAAGTFSGALSLGLRTFRAFTDAAAQLPDSLKDKTVVAFCTGGIRCNKAVPALAGLGFTDAWELEGGILHYFEKVGGAHWQGDCFVFDARGAVDPQLTPAALDQESHGDSDGHLSAS